MSPSYLHHDDDHHHRSCRNGICALKINKDSGYTKKSSSSLFNQQQRHQPVIIYTHSPKIIHTHPRDFMALVQKLTGLSSHHPTSRPNTNNDENNNNPIFHPLNTGENEDIGCQNINNDFGYSLNFLNSAYEPFCSYTDPLLFMSTMENSITFSSSSESTEFPDF